MEDHADTARALTLLLRRAGYHVRSAADAEEALRLAVAEEFDLVVSDVGLPGGDGYELMRLLRDRFGLRGVAMTGYPLDRDVEACRAAGFLDRLAKPIEFDELEVVVRRSLQA